MPKRTERDRQGKEKIICHVSRGICNVSCVLCHVSCSCVTCCVSPVTCHLSLMRTSTATDPPPANSPTMHSTLFAKTQKPRINIQNPKYNQNVKNTKQHLEVCQY